MHVVFLCTHNSARSQMAEGLLRDRGVDGLRVSSAGTEKTRVHPLAVEAMDEIGISLASHRSKHLDEVLDRGSPDFVITVCDAAAEACPDLPGATRRIHWSVADPSLVEGEHETRLAAFRSARDELSRRIDTLLSSGGLAR